MKTVSFILLMFCLATSLAAQHHHEITDALNAGEISAEHSLYHLDAEWTDHRGETYALSDFSGEPVIVVMFYGNCTQVCPMLIQDTRRLYSMVDEANRPSVTVLAITFDTENDTPDVLRKYAEQEQLNIPGWHFMTSEAASVRSLAMMLGVQYSKKSDGHFAHSNLVTVFDSQGRVAKRVEGLNQPMAEAAREIRSIIKTGIRQ
ncbi:SCO family protein [Aliifodinibius sp. S!AR15-10]|uniref:SCO family protein n=1 Tax=Aliifodinibius sp. S!AR15-10 TaxID=2950437 RepID=UPI0028640272|nr:SCO family protein [Aliifodinibius sp. S!AR15-10]MDR8390759.1 SCO family protein [Aliifodinibius sp. S!AR15-10]